MQDQRPIITLFLIGLPKSKAILSKIDFLKDILMHGDFFLDLETLRMLKRPISKSAHVSY